MAMIFGFSFLVLIALVHSVLGERELLRPLFAAQWDVGLPRYAVERIFRFAWHMTSIAWVGLGVLLLGVPIVPAVAAVCLLSAAMVFVSLRGHLAWPLFLLAGGFTLVGGELLTASVAMGLAGLAGVVAVAVAGLHLYWALGGRVGLANALPQRPDGTPLFEPGPMPCAAVALACLSFAGLLAWRISVPTPILVDIALAVAVAVFALRAIGDGKTAGFTKQERGTPFGKADDAVYTPLVFLLLVGTLCGFLV